MRHKYPKYPSKCSSLKICTVLSMLVLLRMSIYSGNALMTVATGDLSEAQADRAGLVPTHAYAVLNVVHVQVRFTVVLF